MTFLLYLLINYMLAREAPEMLSVKDEYASFFLNFIVLYFCNSLANY